MFVGLVGYNCSRLLKSVFAEKGESEVRYATLLYCLSRYNTCYNTRYTRYTANTANTANTATYTSALHTAHPCDGRWTYSNSPAGIKKKKTTEPMQVPRKEKKKKKKKMGHIY